MVFPHRACGVAAGAALFPVYRWALFETSLSSPRLVALEDKVTAGGTPADPATLV